LRYTNFSLRAETKAPSAEHSCSRATGKRGAGTQANDYWSEAQFSARGLLPAASPLLPNPHGPRDVASVLDRALAERPDGAALIGRFGRLSYAELDEATNAAAAAFDALGISEGDRIARLSGQQPFVASPSIPTSLSIRTDRRSSAAASSAR